MWERGENVMQNWDGCSSLAEHEIIDLVDVRDDNTYKVSKLKDGKCWMVTNLQLGDDKLKNRELTTNDTDLESGTYTMPQSTIPASNQTNNDGEYFYYEPGEYGNNGPFGGWYSWKVATARSETTYETFGDAKNSICPRGWHLPTGGSGGEFEVMAKTYGSGRDQATSIALQSTPAPNVGLFGYYNPLFGGRGSSINLWSSTAYNTANAYGLYLHTRGVDPSTDYNPNHHKLPVRCING